MKEQLILKLLRKGNFYVKVKQGRNNTYFNYKPYYKVKHKNSSNMLTRILNKVVNRFNLNKYFK